MFRRASSSRPSAPRRPVTSGFSVLPLGSKIVPVKNSATSRRPGPGAATPLGLGICGLESTATLILYFMSMR